MYNGYTETPERIEERQARWKIGGYGWHPQTDEEREQVRVMLNITLQAQAEFDAELGTHPTISGGEVIEFGSSNWFENIEPLPY